MPNKYYIYRPFPSSRLSKTWNHDELPSPTNPTSGLMATQSASTATTLDSQLGLPQLDPSLNTPFNSPDMYPKFGGNGKVISRGPRSTKSVDLKAIPRPIPRSNYDRELAGHGDALQQPPSRLMIEIDRELGTNEIAAQLYVTNRALFEIYISHQNVYGLTNVTSPNGAPQPTLDFHFSEPVLAARRALNKAFLEVEAALNNPYMDPVMRRNMVGGTLAWLVDGRLSTERMMSVAREELDSPAGRQEQLLWGKPRSDLLPSTSHSPASVCSGAIVRLVDCMSIISSIDAARRHALMGDWTWRTRC